MTQLLSLVLLFLAASAFNLNGGAALTPLMVLFLNFSICIFPVVAIMLAPPDLMTRPPATRRSPSPTRAPSPNGCSRARCRSWPPSPR